MLLKLFLLGIWGLLQLYGGILVISFILSWIPSANEFKIFRLINRVSDWYLEPFRGKIIFGFLDMGSMIGLSIFEGIVGLILTCISLV